MFLQVVPKERDTGELYGGADNSNRHKEEQEEQEGSSILLSCQNWSICISHRYKKCLRKWMSIQWVQVPLSNLRSNLWCICCEKMSFGQRYCRCEVEWTRGKCQIWVLPINQAYMLYCGQTWRKVWQIKTTFVLGHHSLKHLHISLNDHCSR